MRVEENMIEMSVVGDLMSKVKIWFVPYIFVRWQDKVLIPRLTAVSNLCPLRRVMEYTDILRAVKISRDFLPYRTTLTVARHCCSL